MTQKRFIINRVGLLTILIAITFWYGLGFLNENAKALTTQDDIIFAIGVFTFFFIASYALQQFFFPLQIKQRYYDRFGAIPGRKHKRTGHKTLILCMLLIVAAYAVTRPGSMVNYHLVRSVSAIAVLSAVLVYFERGSIRLVYLSIAIAVCLYSLTFYSRRPFLVIAAALVMVPLLRFRIKSLLRIFIGSFALVAGYTLVTYITGVRFTAQFIDVLENIRVGNAAIFNGLGFDTIHLTDFAFSYYNSERQLGGETFIAGIFNLVPRAFWPDKPIAFGIILSSDYFGVAVTDVFTNFGPGLIAEAYANFGYIGILGVSIALGVFVGFLDNFIFLRRSFFLGAFIAAASYPALFFLIRGDFVNSFYELYSKILVGFAVILLSGNARTLLKIGRPNDPRVRFGAKPLRQRWR